MNDEVKVEVEVTRVGAQGIQRFVPLIGVMVGSLVYAGLTQWFGVVIEAWEGADTFTRPGWFAAVAVAPIVSGFVTGVIAGRGGKWWSMAPLCLVHPIQYAVEPIRKG